MSEALRLDDLAPEARRELLDFYEFLKKKYGSASMKNREVSDDDMLYNRVSLLTRNWRFDRNEVHER